MDSTSRASTAPGPPAPRLFCFHHAGGGPSSFLGWRDRLGPRVEVRPLTFAGRGTDLSSTAAALNETIGRHDDVPFAFYGHSMGALVAYHVARLRAALRLPAPLLLAVGASAAPDVPGPIAGLARLPDAELLAVLARIGGWTRPAHFTPQWADLALTRIRADLALWTNEQARQGATPASSLLNAPVAALDCPIEAFAGLHDPLVPMHAVNAWHRHTAGSWRLHRITGGHFFTRDPRGAFFTRLSGALDRALAAA